MKGTYNLPAPGKLETVRKLMNTWVVPSATRMPEDRLPALVRDQEAWRQTFPEVPLGADDSVELLVELRDELRRHGRWRRRLAGDLAPVAGAVPAYGRRGDVSRRDDGPPRPAPWLGSRGLDTRRIVDAVSDDTWFRLKRCPDCQWIFYDRTRSRTKVWCDMLAGDAGGRSCGTIAKVRRYRERQSP